MLASVRAGFAAALVAFSSLSPPLPPTNPSSDPISPTARSGSKPRSRPSPARSQSPSPRCAARRMPPSRKRDFRAGMQTAGADRLGRAARSRQLAAPRRARSCRSARPTTASAPLPRARRDRRLHRLSALRQCRRRGRRAGAARPHLRRAQAVAPGARCAAASRSTCAKSPTCAQQLRAAARRARLPPSRLLGRCGRGVAARLLPVLRGSARQAHGLLALRRGRRQRQARASPPKKSSFASKA